MLQLSLIRASHIHTHVHINISFLICIATQFPFDTCTFLYAHRHTYFHDLFTIISVLRTHALPYYTRCVSSIMFHNIQMYPFYPCISLNVYTYFIHTLFMLITIFAYSCPCIYIRLITLSHIIKQITRTHGMHRYLNLYLYITYAITYSSCNLHIIHYLPFISSCML